MSVFRRERAAGRSGFWGGTPGASSFTATLTRSPLPTQAPRPWHTATTGRELDEGEGRPGIKVLDWQTFTYGPGLYDVANIVVCSMTVTECEKHCKRLLRLYQSRLSELGIEYECAAVVRFQVSPPPRCRFAP